MRVVIKMESIFVMWKYALRRLLFRQSLMQAENKKIEKLQHLHIHFAYNKNLNK